MDRSSEPAKPRKARPRWIQKLERLGWRLAMRHDLMRAEGLAENSKLTRLYDLWAPVYDLMFRRLESFKAGGQRLVDHVVRPGDWVLDLGTGTGIHMDAIFQKTPHVVGLDLTRKMLVKAQNWCNRNRLEPMLLQASATDIPLADESVDAALAAYMMVYLNPEQTQQCLEDLVRVLRPGGRFGILCGAGERSPRNPTREAWQEYLLGAGFSKVEFDDFYDVLRVVIATK